MVASNPSFSPDGKSIAFTHLTSNNPVFLLSDLINQTYSSNIYLVSATPGELGKLSTPIPLTTDGNSLDPSWGVVKVSVDVEKQGSVVKSFKLLQNYPNPFNAETTIFYEILKESSVRLSLYNVKGELLTVLLNQRQEAGLHSFTWKAERYNSGLYFYKLEADGFVDIKKCLLVK